MCFTVRGKLLSVIMLLAFGIDQLSINCPLLENTRVTWVIKAFNDSHTTGITQLKLWKVNIMQHAVWYPASGHEVQLMSSNSPWWFQDGLYNAELMALIWGI